MTRKMKDSGIEWIGEIPGTWNLKRIGQSFIERNEKVSDVEFPPLSVTMKGVLPQLSTAAKSDAHDARKLMRKGDFAINSRSDRRGSCGISGQDGSVSLINIVLQPKDEIFPDYYNWLFHSTTFSEEFYKWGHGIVDDLWTTNWSDMKKITVPFPPLLEQRRISRFLDSECAKIDRLIEQTRASIEEYKKLKQAMITEAVTKGVRGKRKMKDSGIPWIGEIPEEWEIKTVFQIFTQVKNVNIGMQERNLLSLSYGTIKRKDINTTEGLLPASFEGYNIIEDGDIVLRLTDLQNDQKSFRVGLAKERGIITSAYITLRNRSNVFVNYLYYFLHAFDVSKGFYGMGAGIRESLNWDGLKSINVLVPTRSEQYDIVFYLDGKTTEIDNLIAQKESLIRECETYKKGLIYEYTTGKKSV